MAIATPIEMPLAINLSAPVLVSRYLAFWRRVLPWSLLICLLGLILRHSALWLIPVALSGLGYAVGRYPTRWSIRLWTQLWMVATPVVGVWAAREVLWVLRDEFSIALLLALGDICLLSWVTARISREPAPMTEEEPGTFQSFTKEPGTFQPFTTLPSFSDRWLSGGWRTSYIFGSILSFSLFLGEAIGKSVNTILLGSELFAFVVTSVIVVPWALIPVARALKEGSPIALLRAITRSRAHAPYGSYTSFVLRHPPTRPLSILWLGAFVLLGIGGVLIFAWAVIRPLARSLNGAPPDVSEASSFVSTSLLASATLPLFSFSSFAWRRARQEILRYGLKSGFAGSEPSTLYLRSFFEDQVRVLKDGLRYRVWFTDPIFTNIRFVRFEEVVAHAVWPFGGLTALARPGERLPELGAVRVTGEGRDWQDAIECLMDHSQHILTVVGLTSGLKWEFQQAQLQARLPKVLLLIPPQSPGLIARTWRNFVSDSPSLLSCREELAKRSLAVRFRDDGVPVFLSAERRSVAAYRVALDACWLPLNDLLAATRDSSAWRPRFGWRLAWARVTTWLVACLISSVLFLANAPNLIDLTDPLQPMPPGIPLTSTGRLRVGNVHFRERRDGPPRSSTSYRPGDVVLMTYQLAGVGRDTDGRGDVHMKVMVRDPAGVQAFLTSARFNDAIGYGRRTNWWLQMRLPLFAPEGEYRLEIALEDALNGSDLSFQPGFKVMGPPDIKLPDLLSP